MDEVKEVLLASSEEGETGVLDSADDWEAAEAS